MAAAGSPRRWGGRLHPKSRCGRESAEIILADCDRRRARASALYSTPNAGRCGPRPDLGGRLSIWPDATTGQLDEVDRGRCEDGGVEPRLQGNIQGGSAVNLGGNAELNRRKCHEDVGIRNIDSGAWLLEGFAVSGSNRRTVVFRAPVDRGYPPIL